MIKDFIKAGLIGLFLLMLTGVVNAVNDPPHDSTKSIDCYHCHASYATPYPDNTVADNAALCMTCHYSGASADSLPFAEGDQATPGSTGNSHRWDADMTAISDDPNNQYGLRSVANLSNAAMKTVLTKYNNKVVCSACHNQHYQDASPWDLNAGGGSIATADLTSPYSTLTVSGTPWVENEWAPCSIPAHTTQAACESALGTWAPKYVKFTVGYNKNRIKMIVSNTTNSLTTQAFPYRILVGNAFIVANGRHYQRTANDFNQMCEDCHYYRSSAAQSGSVYQTDVRTWDGKKKSHPMNNRTVPPYKIFTSANGEAPTVSDPNQFNAAPLEPASASWAQQTSTRYQGKGGVDENSTNNYIIDAHLEIRCLTCHGIHYTDSDSATEDK